MKQFTFVILLLTLICACRPVKETVYRDRIKIEKEKETKIDSIYIHVHDSIYLREKGDTVFLTKYKTVFKNKFVFIGDTILRSDTIRVQHTTTIGLKKSELVFIYLGKIVCIILFIMLIFVLYKLYKKVRLRR